MRIRNMAILVLATLISYSPVPAQGLGMLELLLVGGTAAGTVWNSWDLHKMKKAHSGVESVTTSMTAAVTKAQEALAGATSAAAKAQAAASVATSAATSAAASANAFSAMASDIREIKARLATPAQTVTITPQPGVDQVTKPTAPAPSVAVTVTPAAAPAPAVGGKAGKS